jgi:hypothetical protein
MMAGGLGDVLGLHVPRQPQRWILLLGGPLAGWSVPAESDLLTPERWDGGRYAPTAEDQRVGLAAAWEPAP